jgi:hypothetical protein
MHGRVQAPRRTLFQPGHARGELREKPLERLQLLVSLLVPPFVLKNVEKQIELKKTKG